MNVTSAIEKSLRPVFLLLSVLLGCSGGCGTPEQDSHLDAGAMLERYENDRRRHDPRHFSEVDLGEYTVTQRQEPAIYYIRFRLYGVVPDARVEEFGKLLAVHDNTVRSQVREVSQQCAIDHLRDPSLGWLKSELISSINRVLQAPVLRDVVFADFSFERS